MALCQRYLLAAAGDNPIVSVSQRPVDLGRNVCVGEIGSSWLSIYRQQLAGLEVAQTEMVAIAEHDVCYVPSHFAHEPADPQAFTYNVNCWLVQYKGTHPEYDGMYSYWPRRLALSQLICRRDLLAQSIEERLHLIESGVRVMRRLGEPGAFPPGVLDLARKATDGKAAYLSKYFEDHVTKFRSRTFASPEPTLDVRHKDNFTGARRGKKRCYELPPWGNFAALIGGE